MAGELDAIPILVGLGYEFSMSTATISAAENRVHLKALDMGKFLWAG